MFRTNIPLQKFEMRLLFKSLVDLDKKDSSFQSRKLIEKLNFFYNELDSKTSLYSWLESQQGKEKIQYLDG